MTKAEKIEKHAKEQEVRVEFSRDGGRTWRVWAYGEHAPAIYGRLIKLYPSWDFTLITPNKRRTTHIDMRNTITETTERKI